MSNTPELDFNRLASFNSTEDRNTTLVLGVFKGLASLSMFAGQGGGRPAWRLALSNRMCWKVLPFFLKKLKEKGPEEKIELPVTRYNRDEKKVETYATLIFGRDAKNVAYIGVTGQGVTPAKFLIRLPLVFDLSQHMQMSEQSNLAIDSLVDILETQVPQAVSLTSFKREFSGNKGGGNFGGGGNSQGGNGGGGGGNSQNLDDAVMF